MQSLQTFSKRGLTIILSALFFLIPLSYAWLYVPWIPVTLADIFPQLVGFEKVKVLFFLGLITLATVLFLGTKRLTDKHLMLLSVFFGWTLISYRINQDLNPYFWFGNGEKFHGWYFYLGLLIFTIILSSSTREEQKKYLGISLVSGGIVCLYALFQKIGLDPLSNAYSSRLDTTRIFSTLGNPNYLAGYILMLMPLSLKFVHTHKILWWGVFGILIFTLLLTKSLFGIGLLVAYICYLVIYQCIPLTQKTRHIVTLCIVGSILVATSYLIIHSGEYILEIQKIKGFIARYFLWKTGIHTIFGDIKNTLFGYGPDGFLAVSEHFRSPELSVFEDPNFRIDRSHNVWIDLFIHFGIPVALSTMYLIFSQWRKLPLSHREVLTLFSLFFFFNIPVLVHFILLLQIVTFSEKKSS